MEAKMDAQQAAERFYSNPASSMGFYDIYGQIAAASRKDWDKTDEGRQWFLRQTGTVNIGHALGWAVYRGAMAWIEANPTGLTHVERTHEVAAAAYNAGREYLNDLAKK